MEPAHLASVSPHPSVCQVHTSLCSNHVVGLFQHHGGQRPTPRREGELQARQLGLGGRGSQDPVPTVGADGHLDPALELGLWGEQGLGRLARLQSGLGRLPVGKGREPWREQVEGRVPAVQREARRREIGPPEDLDLRPQLLSVVGPPRASDGWSQNEACFERCAPRRWENRCTTKPESTATVPAGGGRPQESVVKGVWGIGPGGSGGTWRWTGCGGWETQSRETPSVCGLVGRWCHLCGRRSLGHRPMPCISEPRPGESCGTEGGPASFHFFILLFPNLCLDSPELQVPEL